MSFTLLRLCCVIVAGAALTGCATGLGEAYKNFEDGDLTAREGALKDLRAQTVGFPNPPTLKYPAVREPAQRLLSSYNRRAERQQTFLDLGSAITFTGAAGAFEGGLSNSTRTAWAIGAFTPTIISQFNAYEPTRELFHGGALALELITFRYDQILRNARLVTNPSRDLLCTDFESYASRVRGWTQASWDQDRSIRLEADRLLAACRSLNMRMSDLAFVSSYATDIEAQLAASYAADVLRLDHALVGQDRELRYTPSETLSALISAPLRAADLVLTGTSTKSAIDSIATLNAFRGMNQSLERVALPPLPAAAPALAELSPLVRARITHSATHPDVVSLIRDLDNGASRLARGEAEFAFRLGSARELLQAAQSDYLSFDYNTSTRTATVALGRRPAEATATATTGQARP